MELYDAIKELCEKKGITIVGLERELGFGRGSIGKLRSGQSIRSDRLRAIENYFGVQIGSEQYYLNSESAQIAQDMYEDDDMRTLYDIKSKIGEERFKAHVDFMRSLYAEEHPDE